MLLATHPFITLHLYFTLRKTASSADQRSSPSCDVGSQSDSHRTPAPSEQDWVYRYWQAVFISPITVKGETLEHKSLAQPWLPANVAAIELCHIRKAWVTDASCLVFCLCHELSKLETGLHQRFGSEHCRQLGISQTTCSPCLHEPVLYIHPVHCQHFIHCSYFLEPLRVVIPQAMKSLLLGFPSSDEISCYQQRENIC